MQLQIKAQDAGVKRGTLDATTNKGTRCRCKERRHQMQLQIKAEDAGVKRGTLDATTNKGTRCRCKERH